MQSSGILASLLFMLVFHLASAQTPGNVSTGLRWWLRADAETYSNAGTTLATDGVAVQQWNDQSPIGNNATQPTSGNRPIYRTDRINGYPALEFAGDQFLTAASTPGVSSNESFYMFMVFKQNSYLLGATTNGSGTFIIDRTPETNGLMSFKMVTGNRYNYQKRNDSNGNLGGPVSTIEAPTGIFTLIDYYRIFNNSFGMYIDGRQDATLTTNTNDAITGARIQIGRHSVATNQGLYGEFAELALYDVSLSTANRQRIESYFALKYGITLDPSVPQDYRNSGGGIVFPVASDPGYTPYRYDVAGIILDNDSDLDQETSHSQNPNYVLTVSSPAHLANGESLVWGSNNGSLTVPNDVDVDGVIIKRRLSRVWRFFEFSNPGNVTLSFDLSAVPGPKSEASLRLLIDRDDDGFADNNLVMSGTLAGNIITFANVNINDDDNVTIGTTDIIDTPLPVTLVSFDAKYEAPVVKLKWETESEINNDYFAVERSADGIDFSEVGRVQGGGTSRARRKYTYVDKVPSEGHLYYRLKQTDYTGQFDYSDIRAVSVGRYVNDLIVSPNPSNRQELTITRESRALSITSIDLINQQGVLVARGSDEVLPDPGSQTIQYRLPDHLPAGIYILRIVYEGRIEIHKIWFER